MPGVSSARGVCDGDKKSLVMAPPMREPLMTCNRAEILHAPEDAAPHPDAVGLQKGGAAKKRSRPSTPNELEEYNGRTSGVQSDVCEFDWDGDSQCPCDGKPAMQDLLESGEKAGEEDVAYHYLCQNTRYDQDGVETICGEETNGSSQLCHYCKMSLRW